MSRLLDIYIVSDTGLEIPWRTCYTVPVAKAEASRCLEFNDIVGSIIKENGKVLYTYGELAGN